jgi:hypothetical protein
MILTIYPVFVNRFKRKCARNVPIPGFFLQRSHFLLSLEAFFYTHALYENAILDIPFDNQGWRPTFLDAGTACSASQKKFPIGTWSQEITTG